MKPKSQIFLIVLLVMQGLLEVIVIMRLPSEDLWEFAFWSLSYRPFNEDVVFNLLALNYSLSDDT